MTPLRILIQTGEVQAAERISPDERAGRLLQRCVAVPVTVSNDGQN
jgi:hypothetical protein